MTISGERTDIFCRVTGFMCDCLIDVELIRFFHGALQLCIDFDLLCPTPRVGGIKRRCASDVCQLHTSGLSQEQKGLGRLKLAQPCHTWLGHHFQGQKVKGQLAEGGGILWQPPAQRVSFCGDFDLNHLTLPDFDLICRSIFDKIYHFVLFDLFASPFFCVSLGSWVISLTVFGASVTNLNEPPRALATSTIM